MTYMKQLPPEMAMFLLSSDPEVRKQMAEAAKNAQKKMAEERHKNVKICIDKGLIKKTEKSKFNQVYMAEYIGVLAHIDEIKERIIFTTCNKPLLKRKKELNKRFDRIKIATAKETLKFAEKNMEEMQEKERKEADTSYIG
jgi:hypothetical protein